MDTYKDSKDIQELDEKSKEIIKQLEVIEKSLWMMNPSKGISNTLRAAYFKIQNIERINKLEWNQLAWRYEQLLKKYNVQMNDWIVSISDFYKTMSDITRDLSKFKRSDGILLKDMDIDWDIVDVGIALYEWLHTAIETTYNELRDFIKLIIDPDKFDEIWASVWQELIKIMKDPHQFVQTLVEGMKDELWDLLRDIEVIENNSTQIGYIIVLTGLITQVWVSKFLEQVWPWKFLAIMWITDKWGLNKLWKKEWGKPHKDNSSDDTQKEKVDIVDKKWEYMLDNNISPTDASKKIWEYAEYFDVDYLIWDPEKIEAVMEILESIWEYVINNWEKIHKMNKLELDDFRSNFRYLQKKIDNSSKKKKIKKEYFERLENYKYWTSKEAYYILNPLWKPKE